MKLLKWVLIGGGVAVIAAAASSKKKPKSTDDSSTCPIIIEIPDENPTSLAISGRDRERDKRLLDLSILADRRVALSYAKREGNTELQLCIAAMYINEDKKQSDVVFFGADRAQGHRIKIWYAALRALMRTAFTNTRGASYVSGKPLQPPDIAIPLNWSIRNADMLMADILHYFSGVVDAACRSRSIPPRPWDSMLVARRAFARGRIGFEDFTAALAPMDNLRQEFDTHFQVAPPDLYNLWTIARIVISASYLPLPIDTFTQLHYLNNNDVALGLVMRNAGWFNFDQACRHRLMLRLVSTEIL